MLHASQHSTAHQPPTTHQPPTAHQSPMAHRPTPTDTKLQLKDVFEPIKTLAAEEWRDIGEALHIEGVESIPSTPGITRTDEAYLREVLRTWLNTIDPSIQDLITALRECYREEAAKVLESCFAIRTGLCMCVCWQVHMCVHSCGVYASLCVWFMWIDVCGVCIVCMLTLIHPCAHALHTNTPVCTRITH